METKYIRRRAVALVLLLATVFGAFRACEQITSEPPLDCKITYVKVLKINRADGTSYTENWWHIAERMCKNEQHRLGEVVFWMQQVNLYDPPRVGQYVMLPHGEK